MKDFLIHANFLTMITISLFYYYKKFMLTNIYAYKYMDVWEKFSKTSLPEKEDFYSHLNMDKAPLPEKEDFYSHLNMEDITDADYAHPKKSL